jgi:type IV secretion system protein VirB11
MSFGQGFYERDRQNLERACGEVMMSAVRDPEVVEVMLNPDGKLWIERFGYDQEHVGHIPKENAKIILSLVAAALGETISRSSPILEGEFPLDGSRFEGLYPPIVDPGPSFSMRKKASKVFTLADYAAAGTITQDVLQILETAVLERKNIMVVGGTSSGKTTFVNGVIEAIARLTPSHRLVILEDTAELQSVSPNKVNFYTSIEAGVDLRKLAKASMRYAPKRIIVGEVRDAAALELLKLWNTGHEGGIGTFHANSAEEALPRLEELVEEAGVGPKRELIGRAVDLVVYMEKTRDNQRRLTSIMKVNGYNKDTGYGTEIVYSVEA